jgi:hypothetical protein
MENFVQAWVMDNMDLEQKSILVLSNNNNRNHKKSLKVHVTTGTCLW